MGIMGKAIKMAVALGGVKKASDEGVFPAPEAISPVADAVVDKSPAKEVADKSLTTALKKKKKGRYGTLLTGGKGVEGKADLDKKSLLGG